TARVPVPERFAAQANFDAAKYREWYAESVERPEQFWGKRAEEFVWMKPYAAVLEGEMPHAKWFVGGETNLSFNALDRHVAAGRGDKLALIWEGEQGEVRRYTYAELLREVGRAAAALQRLGVQRGDRVTLYLP